MNSHDGLFLRSVLIERNPTRAFLFASILCLFIFVFSPNIFSADVEPEYNIIRRIFHQPIDHAKPDGPKLQQQVDILVPKDVPLDSPVFFNFGNEKDLTDDHLLKYYRLHGGIHPIIYVQAEHRGYGQSLTDDEDQSLPTYVKIDQVLQDAHAVIQELKNEYTGPWIVAGWSYGGGLVIEFAYKYPGDMEVILSSSGCVDWPFLEYGYDRQIKETLGEACYKRLAKHARNLEPSEPFDENWMEREFLYATTQGVVQYSSYKKLQPVFKMLTFLPTAVLIKVLHTIDNKFADGEALLHVTATATKTVGPEEISKGLHNWRLWRYQICTEIGGFIASEDPDGLFTRTEEDFCEECLIQFGDIPLYTSIPEWSQREMAANLDVPLIYVNGGTDPWRFICLEPDFKIKEGKYFFVPEGQHCPERDDPGLAREVLAEMLKYTRPNDKGDGS